MLTLYVDIQEVLGTTDSSEVLFGNLVVGNRVMKYMLQKNFSREIFAKP